VIQHITTLSSEHGFSFYEAFWMNSESVTPPTVSIDDDRQIGVDGTFGDQSLEEMFRRKHWREDMLLMRAGIFVACVGAIFFIVNDYRFFGLSTQFYVLLAVRAVYFAASVIVLRLLPCSRSAVHADHLMVTWCLIAGVATLYITWSRPASYLGHMIVNVGIVCLTYAGLSLPTIRQAILVVPFSLGCVAISYLNHTEGAFMTVWGTAWTFAVANVLGALMSWQLQRRRRLLYLALMRETNLRINLEQMIAEVRTLRGLLKICSWCKRVRDDRAIWQEIEVYVRERTDVNFTHGICPACLDKKLVNLGDAKA
jgi:hypothetical protein